MGPDDHADKQLGIGLATKLNLNLILPSSAPMLGSSKTRGAFSLFFTSGL
jgi:hypothetical protein